MKLGSHYHSRLTALLCGAAAVAWTAPALAQTKSSEPAQVEEVVVTGSLFKQTPTGSQLVTTVSSEQLDKLGAVNATEALRTIASNQPINVNATSIGAGTAFASYANLRTLGSPRTLILFDSKRVVNNPYQDQGVDLNTIPLNLIDRVETLADGASSIYGSDAIAGVINFIPKQELRGLSIEATGFVPEKKGGRKQDYAISGGFGSLAEQGWNIYAGYTYSKTQELLSTDRSFADHNYYPDQGLNRLQDATFPANVYQGDTIDDVNPGAPACDPPRNIFVDGTCQFDFSAAGGTIEPKLDQQTFLVHGVAKAFGQTFTLEAFRAHVAIGDGKRTGAGGGIGLQIFDTLTPDNPYFPGKGITPGIAGLDPNEDIDVNWRIQNLPENRSTIHSTVDRVNGQMEGSALGFDYQVWGLYSKAHLRVDDFNDIDVQAITDGLSGANGAPFLNPFGPQSAEGQAYMLAHIVGGPSQFANGKLTMFGAQATRDLFDLPAGPVKFALAVDYKKERSSFETTEESVITDSFDLVNIDGSRNSWSATTEVKVPILDNLDLDASLRYDHYSDFGGTTNPKVLLSWRATDRLTLHASYNTGFRAPTLYDLLAPNGLLPSRTRFPDPILCPGGVVNTAAGGNSGRDCGGNPLLDLVGGNPDLGPEESKAYSVGFRFRPTDSIQVGADYWNYHLTKTVGPVAESAIFGDLARFGDLLVRCSVADPAIAALVASCDPGHTGDPIAYIAQTSQNLGDTNTDGIDITFNWRGPETAWGRLSFDYSGTIVTTWEFQRLPGGDFFSRRGRYFDNYPVVPYSHFAALNWRMNDWTVELSNRYLSGYTDCNDVCSDVPPDFRKVSAYSLFNLSGTWKHDRTTVIGRITNLFNTDPPFTNKVRGPGTAWDERLTDPIGRAYSVTVKYDFF